MINIRNLFLVLCLGLVTVLFSPLPVLAGKASCDHSDAKVKASCCGTGEADCPTCGSTGAEATPAAADHGYIEVNTFKVKELIDGRHDVLFVDARTPKYDDGRRIPGALYLPADADDVAIAKALPDKEKKLVLYCSNLQCPASAMLAEKLLKLGYKGVHKYPDGIDAWEAAGGKIEMIKK